ncbi:hypothetical protein G7K_2583-t1 [Saitoella complicata NRRL Y-17804]|uniref:Uncharacterized protein n=1 Tax=Saitoella complicata (strain BCRC 22490 / CBS 7301 / JCM 7358 / NBRC 10748 / NRRL Y-17804) TaxID=698492 RepID=A0A0E9NG90_SAICN|nr:hypothetical protein G7K_2583-t1 [Saitoella complicata NRRL Y-17804]
MGSPFQLSDGIVVCCVTSRAVLEFTHAMTGAAAQRAHPREMTQQLRWWFSRGNRFCSGLRWIFSYVGRAWRDARDGDPTRGVNCGSCDPWIESPRKFLSPQQTASTICWSSKLVEGVSSIIYKFK